MRRVRLFATASGTALAAASLFAATAFAANPAGAPATNIGPAVAAEVQASIPAGAIVSGLAPLNDEALGELGLTPPTP
jgi:hypothetical protein